MYVTLGVGTAQRLHVGLVAVLIAVVVFACGVLGDVLWRHHSAVVAASALRHAEARLVSLPLPADLSRSRQPSCAAGPDRLCVTTELTPAEVRPLLRRLLRPTSNNSFTRSLDALSRTLTGSNSLSGPVTVYGHIDGYPAVANAFGHLLVVRHGTPPTGAVPRKPGDQHLFFRGSDITIDLITP